MTVVTQYFLPTIHSGAGSLDHLPNLLKKFKSSIVLIDKGLSELISKRLSGLNDAKLIAIDTSEEPTVEQVDSLATQIRSIQGLDCLVGIGGGSTLDITKALANLFNNPGSAEKYQGWDLLENPSIHTIGVPTIPGTGAESSKTCVLLNKRKNIKLGMNSPYSMFNEVICDPHLLKTIPPNQYFINLMDAFFHSMELKNGRYRNFMSDLYANSALNLIDEIFSSSQPMSTENLTKALLASFLAGSAIANGFVGILHPFSAGLSSVLGIKHCLANCIVMQNMEQFYPLEYHLYTTYKSKHQYTVPIGVNARLEEATYQQLYEATICHQKPLVNALGDGYLDILTFKKVREIFQGM